MFQWLKKRATEREKAVDITLLAGVLILVIFGLMMLYSTSSYNGELKFGDGFYYLKKQLFATTLGLLVMYILAKTDYHVWRRFAVPAYILSLILSALVLFVGAEYNGSKRWLTLGPLSFQPAEYAKLAVILFIAHLIADSEKRITGLWSLGKIFLMLLPIVGLVGSNNLSTAIIILGIGIVLVFVSTPFYKPFLGIGIVGTGFIAIFLAVEQYRLERLLIWRNPEKYEKGYQTLQGLYAIGSGGLFGRGFGESMQKLGFVPEAQNDMIFSIICEELGLVAAVALLGIFLLIIWRFMLIATRSGDLFGTLIATGILTHISLQVLLNVAVVTNTIPNTGITLPFVSYGGTSVVFLLGEMGLALNVSRYTKSRQI